MACVLLLLLGAAAGFQIGRIAFRAVTHVDAARQNAGLVVDPRDLHLGEVWEQDGLRYQLRIQNPTPRAVEIVDFHVPCGCVAVRPNAVAIPAGGSVSVELEFNLTASTPASTLGETWPFSFSVVPILAGGGQHALGWQIKGFAKPALVFTPPVLEFTEPLVHGATHAASTVLVQAVVPLDDVNLLADGELLTVDIRSWSEDRRRFELQVTPKSTLRLGELSTAIRLRPAAHGPRIDLPAVHYSIRGVVVDNVRLTPPVVDFGAVAVGSTQREIVLATARDGRAFSIVRVSTPSPSLSIHAIPRDGGVQLTVQQEASLSGRQSMDAWIDVDYGDGVPHRVPLQVAYYGVDSDAL